MYTKLYLLQVYQHIEFVENTKLLTTINTSNRLYMYNILSCGVNCAHGIFQRAIEQVIQGI